MNLWASGGKREIRRAENDFVIRAVEHLWHDCCVVLEAGSGGREGGQDHFSIAPANGMVQRHDSLVAKQPPHFQTANVYNDGGKSQYSSRANIL